LEGRDAGDQDAEQNVVVAAGLGGGRGRRGAWRNLGRDVDYVEIDAAHATRAARALWQVADVGDDTSEEAAGSVEKALTPRAVAQVGTIEGERVAAILPI